MTGRWDELHQKGNYHWMTPDPAVVNLVPELLQWNCNRILDLGCGEGRHIIYLAQEGFAMYGLDISETAILRAKKWLWQEMLDAELVNSDFLKIPYGNNFFDAVIAIKAVYHNTLDKIRQSVKEIHRVLKPGGVCFLNLITQNAEGYGTGEMVEPNAFILDRQKEQRIIHYYFDEPGAKELLADFKILEFELIENTEYDEENKSHFHSYWNILVEKPSP